MEWLYACNVLYIEPSHGYCIENTKRKNNAKPLCRMNMYLAEFLSSTGFDITNRIKLVLYESLPVVSEERYLTRFHSVFAFENCDYILVFLEIQNGHALFIGAYKKIGIINCDKTPESMEYPYPRLCDSYYCLYRFDRIDLMEERIHQMVIYWGGHKKTLKWLRLKNAKIIRL